MFFLFLIRKMTFSSKSLYFSNDSSWRAFRTFSPRAPDKYFYVVYVWAKGVNYIYIFLKRKKNVFRRKRIREVGVLVDKLSWLRKPVRLTNLDLPMLSCKKYLKKYFNTLQSRNLLKQMLEQWKQHITLLTQWGISSPSSIDCGVH